MGGHSAAATGGTVHAPPLVVSDRLLAELSLRTNSPNSTVYEISSAHSQGSVSITGYPHCQQVTVCVVRSAGTVTVLRYRTAKSHGQTACLARHAQTGWRLTLPPVSTPHPVRVASDWPHLSLAPFHSRCLYISCPQSIAPCLANRHNSYYLMRPEVQPEAVI